MSRILLSIKPKYVNKILDGTKKYEFRKIIATKHIDNIVIYCTYPQMGIVGEVEVKNLICLPVDELWKRTADFAGISKLEFIDYYSGKKNGVAYELGKVINYSRPIKLENYGVKYAPQSFIYLDE